MSMGSALPMKGNPTIIMIGFFRVQITDITYTSALLDGEVELRGNLDPEFVICPTR